MKRRQTYTRGSKGLLYINQGVSDNLIGFINKQTELNGVLLLGIKLVAEKYGDIDVINNVPRTFDIQTENPASNNEGIDISPSEQRATTVTSPITEIVANGSNSNPVAEELEDLVNDMKLVLAENKKLKLEIQNIHQERTIQESEKSSTLDTKARSNSSNLFDKDADDPFDLKLD